MNTKQIIQNMEKEFDERFPGDVVTMEKDGSHARITSSLYNRDSIKSFIHSYIYSLLSAFAEEVIGKDLRHVTNTKGEKNHTGDVDADEIISALQDDIDAVNEYKNEQRLKAKEIIKSLE